jgi:hypothetical protein
MRAASAEAMPDRLGAMSDTTTSTGRPPAPLELLQHGVLAEVALQEVHALDRLHRQQVQRQQRAVEFPRRRPALPRHLGREAAAQVLAPGAGRRPEVDHHLPGRNRRSASSISLSL